MPLADRFWPKVRKSDGCWEWAATRLPKGYGQIGAGGKGNGSLLAHRVAWTLASGEPIPGGFDVLHACDNPPCCRNDEPGIYIVRGIARPRWGHLWLGTELDNSVDMIDKGRARFREGHTPESARRGERSPTVKVTEAMVREIRRRYVPRKVTLESLAIDYNLSPRSISRIVRRERWANLDA